MTSLTKSQAKPCSICHGTGKVHDGKECPACKGRGEISPANSPSR